MHGLRAPTQKVDSVATDLKTTRIITPITLHGPMNGNWFKTYVSQVLRA